MDVINDIATTAATSISGTSTSTSSYITAQDCSQFFKYTNPATCTWSTWNIEPVEVSKVLNNIPLITKITKVNKLSKKQIQLSFEKISHRNENYKFLFKQGCILINAEYPIYGVYAPSDYWYWQNIIQIDTNEEDIDKIHSGMIMTNANCFDFNLSNDDIIKFMKDYESYKLYAHLELEKLFTDSKEFHKSVHDVLDTYLD